MAKAKRRAARKTSMGAAKEAQDEINRRNNAFLNRTEDPPQPVVGLHTRDIMEIVEAAGHTLRSMRHRITQLEVENQRLQNTIEKMSN